MGVAKRSRLSVRIAAAVLIISLSGLLWVKGDGTMRLTGERLLSFARKHPPKPWRGFEIEFMDVGVDNDEVHIKVHVVGHMIHTPIDIIGRPEYDAQNHAMYFHVRQAEFPRDTTGPVLRHFNAMLNPLATDVAQHLTNLIPAKHITEETNRGALFVSTVKAVRVEGKLVVVEFHDHWINGGVIGFGGLGVVTLGWLLVLGLRRRS